MSATQLLTQSAVRAQLKGVDFRKQRAILDKLTPAQVLDTGKRKYALYDSSVLDVAAKLVAEYKASVEARKAAAAQELAKKKDDAKNGTPRVAKRGAPMVSNMQLKEQLDRIERQLADMSAKLAAVSVLFDVPAEPGPQS